MKVLRLSGDMSHRYGFGPFVFHSEIELPELSGLLELGAQELLPVNIHLGNFGDGAEGLVRVNQWIEVSESRFLLTVPEVGRYLARDGCEVLIAPAPGVSEIDLRLYLLGSVFGALCHQNGLLPLHASAIDFEGRVTAFLGDSGAGKSTLAAFMARCGYTVVSDDICLLGRQGRDELTVIPVAGWLKLWGGSLDGLGESPIEANRIMSKDDKFRVYLPNAMNVAKEIPRLSSLVFLKRPEIEQDISPPRIEPISTVETVAELMNMTYLPYLADATGKRTELFRRCASIAGNVTAFRLIAPLGWDRMNETVELIKREVLHCPLRS